MKDPYKEVWDEIINGFSKQSKMIVWLAERTLSAKEFKEFVDEFKKEPDNHDELLDSLREEGR